MPSIESQPTWKREKITTSQPSPKKSIQQKEIIVGDIYMRSNLFRYVILFDDKEVTAAPVGGRKNFFSNLKCTLW